MQTTQAKTAHAKVSLWKSPGVTVARLILDSYLRSGWMGVEFILAIVFLAALFFPYKENTAYFNGTSNYTLGIIAILGPAIMVRQATSARTYLTLARLTSRAAYSRGLMLAAAILRIPVYLFYLVLILLTQRLTDASFAALFWGAVGILPNIILISVITVALSPPIATRLKRIFFLAWIALVLFSFQPVFAIPNWLDAILSIAQLPLLPVGESYTLSVSGNFDPLSLLGLLFIAIYCVIIACIAGRWLEKCELLLY
jgi:hypothetical protein